MKTAISIALEKEVLANATIYAQKHGTDINGLIEHYLKSLTHSSPVQKLIDLVEHLENPTIVPKDADVSSVYYEKFGK